MVACRARGLCDAQVRADEIGQRAGGLRQRAHALSATGGENHGFHIRR
jgi:hypothetical protein